MFARLNSSFILIGLEFTFAIQQIEYFLEDRKIVFEKSNDHMIYYLYDRDGVIGIDYDGVIYYFLKNIQGDIIGILNSQNELIVKYSYDTFGNILSIRDSSNQVISDPQNIGIINPFRYRGYYYDKETELYYLNSRYYNPKWGRFLNADGIVGADNELNSQNLFLYVSNNYVNFTDNNGTVLEWVLSWAGFPVVPVIFGGIGVYLLGQEIAKAAGRVLSQDYKPYSGSDGDSKFSGEHNVYVLIDEQRVIQYVGRTKDLGKTRSRHKNNPVRAGLDLHPVARNISYDLARGLEQELILSCGTLLRNRDFPINNQINGVRNYGNFDYAKRSRIYWETAQEFIEGENLLPCR